ncbi:RHS repeat domain-containing protein [Planctomycetota bacterium]
MTRKLKRIRRTTLNAPRLTTNTYDNLNRLTSSTDNLGNITEYQYDSRNNNKYTKDREDHITRRNYDAMSRLREVIYELPSDDINVQYGLDMNGRLTTLTDDNNNVTTYGYDAVNRRNLETLPDTTTKVYTFDQYGMLDLLTDNNESQVTHSYDNALRLTGKTIVPGPGVEGTTSETFVFDGLNRMTSAANNETTVTMQYDSLGNMVQETQQIGVQSVKSVASQYNDLSFRTSLTYPNNRQITFVPDDLQRIYQIKDASSNNIAQYGYAGPSRVTGRTYYNGTSLTIDYDGGRRAISYTHSGSIGTFGYTYDKEDNKKYENRSFGSKGDAYVYDSIYRLTGVKYGVPNLDPLTNYDDYLTYDSIETFGLDGVGNRISVTNGTTINYTTNNLNQYEQIDSATLDYDNNGNLISGTANTCIYDYANRLLKVTRTSDDRILAEFKYDALGRRYYKKGWDGAQYIETYFYYDGARCIEERNTGDTMIAQYVFGNGIDEVLTMERNSETYYYHENSLGSIYAVTTGTGGVVERYSYDAYGKPSFYDGSGTPIGGTAIGNRILFTGQEYDAETGLCYYYARYYSPEMGRFLNRDPAEDDLLLNLYAYVGNNPINFIDPFGTDRLHLKYITEDVGFKDRAWAGFPSKFKDLDDLIAKIKSRVGKPIDKTGKDGNCIEKLTIYAHSGRSGLVRFSPLGYRYDFVTPRSFSKAIEAKLRALAPYFCEGAVIVLRQCSSAAGDEGTETLKKIASAVQVNVLGATSDFRFGFNPSGWKKVTPEGKVTHTGTETPPSKKKVTPEEVTPEGPEAPPSRKKITSEAEIMPKCPKCLKTPLSLSKSMKKKNHYLQKDND